MAHESRSPSPAPFRRLVWSNLAAQSAEQIALAAAPIIAVLSLNAGPGETGFLTAITTLPFLLLSFPFGVVADRVSRRSVMVAAEAMRVLALLAVPLLAIAGALSIPALAALGFAAAAGTVAFTVAAPALIPALVPRSGLVSANSQMEIVRSLAFMAGPALAGALVGWAGVSLTFALAATLSAVAVALLIGIPEPPRQTAAPRHVMHDLKDGAGFVWTHALLRPVLLTAAVWNIAFFALQAIYVPFAVHTLGLTASGVGITLAIYGFGLVAGALVAARIIRLMPFGRSILIGPIVSVGASALMAASAWTGSPILAGASFFLFGAGPPVWVVAATTLRQAVTPNDLMGRISAAFLTVNAGARPVGAALGGLVASTYGSTLCLVAITLGFVVQAIIITASPIRTLRKLPETTSRVA
jgi:predicted MFS family arabinose efflux permease